MLHRFRDIAVDRSEIAIWLPLLCLTPPAEGFHWDDLRKNFQWMSADGRGSKCRRNIAENFNRLSRAYERYRQTTDDRQRDDRRTGDSSRDKIQILAIF